MSGRGEPRGGAGATGETRRIPPRGRGNGRWDPEGSGGRPGSRPEPRIPPAACRSSNSPLRQVLNWGGGCPGVPPDPLWSCREAPLALCPQPRAPAYPPCVPPAWRRRWDTPLPKGGTQGPPALLGGTVLGMALGRHRAPVFTVSSTHPSYKVLVHSRGVWTISQPLWLCVPFPAGQGAAPVKPSYLQAQHGGGLRCSGRALNSGA